MLQNKSKFVGVIFGLEIKGRHKLGLGIYNMQDPIILTQKLNQDKYPNANDSIYFNFKYNSLFYEYIWYQTKRWELSTPFHIGSGNVDLSYRDTLQHQQVSLIRGKKTIFLGSGSVQYKLTRWFALGAGVGYRFVFSRDENLIKGLNAPIYVYRAKILMGELLKMWFKKDYVNLEWDAEPID